MSEMSFEQMLDESFKTIHNGEVVEGTVIDVKEDEIILNIGCKADGIITKAEYTTDNSVDLRTVVHVGDKMEAKVMKVNDGEGQILLTYRRLAAEKGNKRLEEAMNTQEILKALVRGAKILILDEPTAVLTTQEIQDLFNELKELKKQGYTFIFISHKLNEIMDITDRMTILRGGRSMGIYETASVTPQEISRLMVGRDVVLKMEKEEAKPTDEVLRVRDVEYVNEWGKKMLNKVSFSLRKGEILGIAGVEGNGQKELVDMLFGFNHPNAGTISVNGENIIGLNQRECREKHISLVPEDRMLYGIAGDASIEENLISDRAGSPEINNGPLFNMGAIHKMADQLIKDYTVLCKSRTQKIGSLSGGNIQKVVVAREFSNDPVLIIADQPTRGIDVGATEFIRKKLVELSRSGIAVLLISADLNEVMELSDSLMIMHGGEIAAYFEDTRELSDELMGKYMLGIEHQSPEEIRRVCHE